MASESTSATRTESFIMSSARTVHRGTREDGAECGQTHGSEWASVDAEDAEEAVMRYNLVPCSKCISNSSRLDRWRMDVHSAYVVRSADTPERWTDEF